MVCCILLTGCKNNQAVMPEAEYATLRVSSADRQLTDTYPATIRGRQDIDIFPQVGGFISEVVVKEGQKVRKGETLFIIDQVPYKAAYQTAEANVEAAKAGVSTAQLVYDSKKELFNRNVVSQFDLSTAENSLLTAKAQLAQAEAQLTYARNDLSYTVVKSPSNGVVGTIPYRVGALVGPSISRPLTTVSDNSEMYVYFSMTENQLLSLTRRYGSIDNALKSMPDVQLQLSDGSSYSQPGRIETISGVIDLTTGSVSLRAVFPNEGHLLHSGGSGNVVIPSVRENCLIIPQIATLEIQDKKFVYKVSGDTPQRTVVEVTPVSNGQEYIIESGLSEGDVIIAEGVGLIREGMPVKIK
ncbi:MAG: efflux RND transporter periplasmic adaptor subunit [Tannerellaceae bacterium]|nr:efflux RND transporter periplasmic adaptor subunit [Tannerellaceae bacterium]